MTVWLAVSLLTWRMAVRQAVCMTVELMAILAACRQLTILSATFAETAYELLQKALVKIPSCSDVKLTF